MLASMSQTQPATPASSAATQDPGLALRVFPFKPIYSRREGIRMGFGFTASKPVQLCLEKKPMAQFYPTIARLGFGKLPISPTVTQDTQVLFNQSMRIIKLKPGERYVQWLDLKQYALDDGRAWESGEYRVSAEFRLCDQNAYSINDPAAKETVIKSVGSARFMIVD
jgi:hypothetical protein